MIQLSSLSKSFGDRMLLDAVTWQIDDRERVGLCGPNGAGKTTLLRMLASLDESDSGTIVKPAALTVGYLPQDGLEHRGRTVFEEAASAFAPLLAMKAEMHELEERMSAPEATEADQAQMLDRYSELSDRFRFAEGYSIDLQVATVLGGLGFSTDDFQRPAETFGRLADADRAREAAAGPSGPSVARRADEPPRSRGAQLAGKLPPRVSPRRHPRLARSLLSRRGRDEDCRSQPAHADRLPRQLQRLPRRA